MSDKKTYLMYNPKKRYYKIGLSKNPEKRLLGIKSIHKGTKLICIINGDIENLLHRCFLSQRVELGTEKEWFKLTRQNVRWLKNLSTLEQDSFDELYAYCINIWEDGWDKIKYNKHRKSNFVLTTINK